MQFISGHLGAAASLIDLSYIGRAGSSASTSSTYNWSITAPGEAHVNRRFVIGWATHSSNSGQIVSSTSLGGDTGTQILFKKYTIAAGTLYAGMSIFDVPDGTGTKSGQLIITGTGDLLGVSFSTFRMVNSTATPHDTDFDEVAGDPSGSLDIPENGGAIAFVAYRSATLGVTWTGLTEVDEATYDAVDSMNASSSTNVFTTLQTGRAISVNTVGATQSVLLAASWPA